MKTRRIRPGLIVFTCLIQACIKHKTIENLMPLYEEMRALNINGDAVLFNTLISGLVLNLRISEGLHLAKEASEKKITLNFEVYQHLFSRVLREFDRRKDQLLEGKNDEKVLLFQKKNCKSISLKDTK